MQGDVLTDEAEKLKGSTHSRGLLLPHIDTLPEQVDLDDYNLAVIDIANKFEGIYSIIQNFRSSYFKYHFDTNWNPFILEDSYICKPFLVKDIENSGYDPITANCRCPDVYSPCTLKQSLSDSSIWRNEIFSNYTILETDKNIEDLNIVVENLDRIDINGRSLPNYEQLQEDEKDQHCKKSDLILCSVQGSGSMNTEWSEWSGCSSKCGTGVQERLRIIYDGEKYSLAKETRECKLEDCKHQNEDSEHLDIVIRTVPNNDGSVVNNCNCPNGNEVLVTSDEAWRSIEKWSPKFMDFCDMKLNRMEETNVLRKEFWFNKREILGKNIKIEFSDGYYFDCSGHWGIKPVEDLHMYCKAGSPILCRRNSNKTIQKYSAIDLGKDSKFYLTVFVIMWLLVSIYIVKKLLSFRRMRKTSKSS